MTTFFLVILGFLALLAVIDLFVGVSNDAVNFLNAAIGCRIASFKVVLAVAAAGVLLGASFSGGMMEIAKTGVFHPQFFTFTDVMAIYFGVMVTDVLLLNFFNSLGLPTSTTVSIVFELLGAAAGAAANRLIANGASLAGLGGYINSSKAFAMISAILCSVVIAFIGGVLVQYVTRLIFSFHYEKVFKKIGGIYGGFAIAMIFYFLVMKGAKGASFMTPELKAFFAAYTWQITGAIFVVMSVLLHLGMKLCNLNVFKIIILAGTFALAFAFAGNDLVNFVGVPIAALDSYNIFVASGSFNPSGFIMWDLANPIPPNTIFLLLSGLVMVITLYTSKSARKVLETSVNLSSSRSGEREQFGASLPGRLIVRGSMVLGRAVSKCIPAPVHKAIDQRFEPVIPPIGTEPPPFDAVRASINLLLTAILISMATSLKLPLLTTYVSFMVAMGSSFADRAWDRETAVYRVSGVFAVVSGWFITAFSAFVAAAFAVTLVIWGGEVASVIMMAIALYVIIKTNFLKKDKEADERLELSKTDRFSVRDLLGKSVAKNYRISTTLFQSVIRGFLADDEKALRKASNNVNDFFDNVSADRSLYYEMGLHIASSHEDNDAKFFYFRSFSSMREACRTLQRTAEQAEEHVANRHRVFKDEVGKSLNDVAGILVNLEKDIESYSVSTGDTAAFQAKIRNGYEMLDKYQEFVLSDIGRYGLSLRGCELYMSFLQVARDLLNRYSTVILLQTHLNKMCSEEVKNRPAVPTPDAAPAPKAA